MALILKPEEMCPYSHRCPYALDPNSFCWGARPRSMDFVCDYVREDGTIMEGKQLRSKLDLNGRMKVLREGV